MIFKKLEVGDLIYDAYSEQVGVVVELSPGPSLYGSSFITVLFEDGQIDDGVRANDKQIEVINE